MRIAILGGSFDPPHIGHTLLVRQVLDFANFDYVWLLPAYRHTFGKQLVHPQHRIAMARLLETDSVVVSTLEIDHQLDGHTINLVPLLREQYSQDSFTFIIGSDQLTDFTKWKDWQQLLTQLPFLVVPRPEYPCEPLYANMRVLEHELLMTTTVSSTIVRTRVHMGLGAAPLVPPTVADYIARHRLYTD